MRYLLLSLVLISSLSVFGQEKVDPVTKVYQVLSGQEQGKIDSSRLKGAWEALAYLPYINGQLGTKEQLQEAVPDYYRFYPDGTLLLRLIDPEDHLAYLKPIKLAYRFSNQKGLEILSADNKTLKDSWKILYLDDSYFAVQMEDLRLFFVRTAPQER